MLIDKPEDLKLWLTSHLEPLCDADPAALSKYVLALIKKDKTVEELKDSMMQQMDVFLQSETQNFVDMLFDVVESKQYVNHTQVKEETPSGDTAEESKPEEVVREPKIEADSTTPIRENEKFSDPRPALMKEGDSEELLLPTRGESPADLGPEKSEILPGGSDQDLGPCHQDTTGSGHLGEGHALLTWVGEGRQR